MKKEKKNGFVINMDLSFIWNGGHIRSFVKKKNPDVCVLQESLRQQLRSLERSQEEERSQLAGVNEEAMKRNATEMERCGETIRQHSLTICAMEERLNKSVKKNKDLQSDNSRLKKSIHGESRFSNGYANIYRVDEACTTELMELLRTERVGSDHVDQVPNDLDD